MNYPFIASRIFNTPLLIHGDKLDAIIAGLGSRLLGQTVAQPQLATEMFTTSRPEGASESGRTMIHRGGVAEISVAGVLAHRTRMNADSSMVLGYESIARELQEVANNDGVTSIVMVMSTPGGEVSGAFELADMVHRVSKEKPVIAVIDAMAASAGYLIASGATEIVSTPTGYAGSIGVVMRHVDVSKAMQDEGVKVTHIFAGNHKVDGNPYEPLPASVRKDFQAEIDAIYQQFVETVASHRRMSAEAVRDTQARTFRAPEAEEKGLVDRVATLDQIIAELQASPAAHPVGHTPARATVSNGGHLMTDTPKAGANQQPADSFTSADIDRAYAEGQESGRKAEADRVASILAHADEKGCDLHLAHTCIQQGLSADQSKAILDGAPKAAVLAATELPGLAHAGGHDLGPNSEPIDGNDTRAIQGMWDQAISAVRN